MKRMTGALALGVVAVLLAATPAKAQYVFLGGGVTKPIGDFNDYAKTGWMAQGGLGFDIGDKGLWAELEGYYGSNKHSDVTGDKTNLIIGMAALGYSFMPGKNVSPYITGGLGVQAHQFKSESVPAANGTDTNLGYTGAFGVGFNNQAKVHLWIEGRFLGSKDSKVLAAFAGLTIQVGK